MAVYIRRMRSVNFRVSQREFEELERACIAGGARSLSEFARSTVLQGLTTSTGTRESFEQVVSSLLDDLRRELQELNALIRAAPKAQQ